MSTFYFPVTLGQYYYQQLVFRPVNEETSIKPFCSVQKIEQTGTVLLSWKEDSIAYSDRGFAYDTKHLWPSLKFAGKDGYVVDFEELDQNDWISRLETQTDPVFRNDQILQLSYNRNRAEFELIYAESRVTDPFVLTLCMHRQDSYTYSSRIQFHMFKPTDFYTVAIDFGSEAVQAAVVSGTDTNPRFVNIFSGAKYEYEQKHNHNKGQNDNYYLQYEARQELEEPLFRSICFKEADGKLIHFCSNKDAEEMISDQEAQILENLKIAYLTGTQDNESYYLFLQWIISKVFAYGHLTQQHGIHLQLLVPNVMSLRNQTMIRERLVRFLDGHAIEIHYFSESDAAFIGYSQRHSLRENNTYLVVDAGKGTTDWSVVKVGKNRSYSTLYSDGVVGAGGLISFALLDHISAIIVHSEKGQRSKFLNKVLQGKTTDMLGRRLLLESIEQLKRAYDCDIDNQENRILSLKNKFKDVTNELSPQAIATYLVNNLGGMGDEYGILHSACSLISADLLNKLKQRGFFGPEGMPIHQVVLSGRAFRFKIFRDVMTQTLKAAGVSAEPFYDDVSAKSQSVVGVLHVDRSTNENSGLQGSINIASEFLEVEDKFGKDRLISIIDMVSSFFTRCFGNSPELRMREPIIDIDSSFLHKGATIQFSEASYLEYNGEKFVIPSPEYSHLLYTGDGFLLRSENSSILLTPDLQRNRTEKDMVKYTKQASLLKSEDETAIQVIPVHI